MPLYKQPASPYWYVRFSIAGVKVRRSTATASREEARAFEQKLRGDLWRQIKLGERPQYTWDEAVERWSREAQGRDRARDAERLAWFAPYLGGVPLAQITRDTVDKLRELRAGEASQSTANRYMALLRMLLRKAQREWDWLDRVPVVPMYRQEKREPRFLTREQFRRLLRELPEHQKALAEFSVETGLRMRNVTHLRWAQIDLRRRLLVVPASRAKAGETISVPLSARAAAILKAQRGAHSEFVFTFRGKPIDDCNGHSFKSAARRAGVAWLRWHDLRHTWASWQAQAGTPLHVLKRLGGWRSMAMVENYAHLSVEALRAYAGHRRKVRS